MVFYLKYRPQRISELDSFDLREKLESALKGKIPDKIPHAFLFTGPKGLGKTSTARIFAKTINCTNRKKDEIEPCNRCSSCKSITSGSNLDVLEIDGASNRGIDEIRDLREKIRLSPLSSLKKVYIIDEVHMLTTEAFNALLKTLEEPPAHAIFILCTTEPQKIPATILSRCFNVRFNRATDEDLVNSFSRIVKGENLKSEKEALIQIAKLSDGSFRDGAKILQELSAYSSQITQKLIEKKYKTATIDKELGDLIDSFNTHDAKRGINIIAKLSEEGIDFKIFTENLIDRLHQSLLSEINESLFEKAKKTSELIGFLAKAHMSIKYAVLPQLPLELTIVEWTATEELRIKNPELRESKKINEESLDSEVKTVTAKKPLTKSSENDNILESLIEKVKVENFSIAGVLRGCKVDRLNDEELVLSTEFKFHKEKLSDPKNIDLIESILKKVGHNLKFSVILKE